MEVSAEIKLRLALIAVGLGVTLVATVLAAHGIRFLLDGDPIGSGPD
jgi:hypothetical protein